MYPKRLRSYMLTAGSSDEPGNTANNFIVRLPEPIDLQAGLYEIGLLNLRIKEAEAMMSDAPVGTLFPNSVKPNITTYVYTVGETDITRNCVSNIDDWAKNNKYPIKLVMLMTEDEKLLVHIRNKSKTETLVIPTPIAKFLGFRRRYFPPGKYWSEIAIGATDLIKKGDQFSFATIHFHESDNIIQMERLYPEKVYYPHRKQDYRAFFDFLEDEMKLDGYDVEFDIHPDDRCEFRFTSKSGRKDEYFVMHEKLAQSLGFTDTKFPPGIYKSEAFDHNVFKTLNNLERCYFEFGRYDTLKLPMNEPQSLYHTVVLHELNRTFDIYDYDEVRPEFKVEDGKLIVKNLPIDTYITLPKQIDLFFEIKVPTVIEPDVEIEVGKPIIDEEIEMETAEKGEDELLASSKVESTRMLVLVDIAAPEFYRGRMIPIVQEVKLANKTKFTKEFFPVLYMPLTSEHVQQIRVQLIDEYGRDIDFPRCETILTFHIKPRI